MAEDVKKRPDPLDPGTTDLSPQTIDSWSAEPLRSGPQGAGDPPSGATPPGHGSSHAASWVPPGPSGPVAAGQVLFGKYRVIERLGRGGMGTVWRVEHLDLECERALKLIEPQFLGDDQARARFRREGKVMARFNHPHAVSVHDARLTLDAAFIEMELVRGRSLDRALEKGRPMPLEWVARIAAQLCDVLQVAHDHQIVHRDLKPSNLMLLDGRDEDQDFLKVLDFGIAKILDSAQNPDDVQTMAGHYLGTVVYSSPEQIEGREIDARSDLYTVGVLLYEFLTGYRPFEGSRALYQHVVEPPPPFRSRIPWSDLPDEVEQVVMACLAKAPEDRPQSARELAAKFARAAGRTEVMSLHRPAASGSPPAPPGKAGSRPPGAGTAAPPPEIATAMMGTADIDPRGASPSTPTAARRGPSPDRSWRKALVALGLIVAATGLSAYLWRTWNPPEPVVERVTRTVSARPKATTGAAAPVDRLAEAKAKVDEEKRVRAAREKTERDAQALAGVGKTEPPPLKDPNPGVPAAVDLSKPPKTAELPPVLALKGPAMNLVLIKPGKFRMGSPVDAGYSNESPEHEVEITKSFYLGETEVTQAQFRDIMDGRSPSAFARGGEAQNMVEDEDTSDFPVDSVSYSDACDFCRRLAAKLRLPETAVRLPTEAEWEFAARGPGGGISAPEPALAESAWYKDNAGMRPHAVKRKVPNVNGLYDMSGNVAEWCQDWLAPYGPEPRRDPTGPDSPAGDAKRVLRGGRWETSAKGCRPVDRDGDDPDTPLRVYGFRVVLDGDAARKLVVTAP